MKSSVTSKFFLVVGLVCAASHITSTRSAAQEVIYQDSLTTLTGTQTLNGTSPATDTTGAKWVAAPNIIETSSGTTLGGGVSAYLPFTVTAGDDYTLSLTIASAANTTYIGGGFAENNQTSQFYGNGQESYMLLSPSGALSYLSPGNNLPATGTYTAPLTLTIKLATTTDGSNWTDTYYANGVLVGTTSDLPEQINYIGIGDLNNSAASGAGDITNIELINDSVAAVPEPSAWALGLVAAAGMLVLTVRRKQSRA